MDFEQKTAENLALCAGCISLELLHPAHSPLKIPQDGYLPYSTISSDYRECCG